MTVVYPYIFTIFNIYTRICQTDNIFITSIYQYHNLYYFYNIYCDVGSPSLSPDIYTIYSEPPRRIHCFHKLSCFPHFSLGVHSQHPSGHTIFTIHTGISTAYHMTFCPTFTIFTILPEREIFSCKHQNGTIFLQKKDIVDTDYSNSKYLKKAIYK